MSRGSHGGGRYPRRPVRVDDSTIEIGGEPVFFRSSGARDATETVVLYLHGLPTSSDDWVPFLEVAAGLAPDLPGFGRTGKGGHLDYTLDGHADFIERFLEDRDVRGDVTLVAHDWGAAAGLVFAQRHPDRIAKLVLINALPLFSGFRWHRPARIWRTRGLGELAMGSANPTLLAWMLRRGTIAPDAWPPERTAAMWEQFDQGTQRAILLLHRHTHEARLAAAGEHLKRLDGPTLIVWGERDPWLPPALAAGYADHLAGPSSVELAPDAGHWPWLDRPALIQRVAQFLA